MLIFMNSKQTKMTDKDKQNNIFQKSKSYEISSTDICQQVKKNICHLVPKTFDFS